MRLLKQSAGRNVMVFMTDAADHVAGKTGLTLTVTASKNGGAFGSISPTVTERGDGWYSLALASGDTDTLGDLVLHVTAAGADPSDLVCQVVAGSLDADISSRLAAAGYTEPDNAGIAAVQAKTDQLTFTVAGEVDANVKSMNDAEVLGDGSSGDKWRGA